MLGVLFYILELRCIKLNVRCAFSSRVVYIRTLQLEKRGVSSFRVLLPCADQVLEDALFGALRAKDVGAVGDESFADERRVAAGALETIIVPMTILERDESSAVTKIARE